MKERRLEIVLLLVVACLFGIWVLGNDPGPEQEEDLPPDVAAALEDARDGMIGEPEPQGPLKELRPGMAWEVTGAGDSSYDGVYEESGTYNGQPAYTNGSKWLFWGAKSAPLDCWCLSLGVEAPTDEMYHGELDTALPGGVWVVIGGAAPAPTVAEYVEPPDPPGTETTSKVRGFIQGTKNTVAWIAADRECRPCRFVSGVFDQIIYKQTSTIPFLPVYDKVAASWFSCGSPQVITMLSGTYAANRFCGLYAGDDATVYWGGWLTGFGGIKFKKTTYDGSDFDPGVPTDVTWTAPQAFSEVTGFVLDGSGKAWFLGVWNDAGDMAYDLYSLDFSDDSFTLEKGWRVTADALALSGAFLAGHEALVASGTAGEFYLLRTDFVNTYVHEISTSAFARTGNPIPATGINRAAYNAVTGRLHVGFGGPGAGQSRDIGRWDPATGNGWACAGKEFSGSLYYTEGDPFGAATI
jgi:hypothetical protein